MRTVLLLAIAALCTAANAEERVVTRTRETGKLQVISVGVCDMFPSVVVDISGREIMESNFTLVTCKETVTYQVKVVTDDKWYTWGSDETVIPGSEVYSYSVHTNQKGSSQVYNPHDPLQMLNVTAGCLDLRNAYISQQIPLADSKCVAR